MAECPGVYRLSLMRDGAMARIRVPGGEVKVEQLRTIGKLARNHGNGLIDLTNRANLQIRGLGAQDGPKLVKALRNAGLLCDAAASDRLRNITASPLAGVDRTEALDVRDQVVLLDEMLQSSPDTQGLSVKFALVVDGGGQGSLRDVGHDLGFFAFHGRSQPMFEISLAGSSSGTAIFPADVQSFVAATLRVLAEGGAARVKDLLIDRTSVEVVNDITTRAGVVLHTLSSNGDDRERMLELGCATGNLVVGIPLARLTAPQIEGLADLADCAKGSVRLTPWQSVVIVQASAKLAPDAEALGFDITAPSVRIVACAGARGCERTEADTKADGLCLREAFAGARGFAGQTIHLSGCPRGCARPGPSDILALAQPESANYALYAGSRPSTAGANPSVRSNISAADLPSALRGMLASSA